MKHLGKNYLEDLKRHVERASEPFYFYDLDHLVDHIKKMENLLEEDFTLWYACKANPMSAILKIFRNRGFGIDVASKGELNRP